MSRRDARSRRLRHRPSRVVPASLVAAALLAVGVLTVLVVVARLINQSWPGPVTAAAAPLADLTWGSTAVLAIFAVISLLGLILLVAGLKLGPFRATFLQAPPGPQAGDNDYVISTRAIARLAAARADTVDGVDQVVASASPRRVRMKVTTTSEHADAVGDRVSRRVADALTSAGVATPPRVSTTVRTKGI